VASGILGIHRRKSQDFPLGKGKGGRASRREKKTHGWEGGSSYTEKRGESWFFWVRGENSLLEDH